MRLGVCWSGVPQRLVELSRREEEVWRGFAIACTASLQFRWLAQPRLHGLFVGEVLVFLLFKGKLINHANHRMRQEAVDPSLADQKAS